jgi:beta-lactamase regulating signal transducer with metallopeptidase domain
VTLLLFPHTSHLYSSLADLAAPLAAGALIAAAWQGAILVALVALTLRLIPRLSATVRSLVWTAVLALAVLLPLLPFAAHAHPAPAATPHAAFHLAEGWSFALAALWAAISLVKLTQLIRSGFHLAAISRRAVEVDPAELARSAPQASTLLHEGRRRPQLCVSSEVDRPSVAGFFSPRILLPVGLLERVTPLELEQILRHEREHLHRADDWVNLAQKLALALFPLNPALLFIERQLANERELACDDTVLRETRAAKAYALCLANLAEISLARRTALLALAAWHKRSELARRVERILQPRVVAMPRRSAATAGALVTLLAVGSAATLAHAPALISFVPGNTLAANDAPDLARAHSLNSLDATMLPAAATPVSADARTLRHVHASNLMLTLPATPDAIPANAPRTSHAFHIIETTQPRRSTPIARETPQQPRRVTQTAMLRQVVANPDGSVTSWTMVAQFDSPAPRVQQSLASDAPPSEDTNTPAAQQQTQRKIQPHQQHYVPTYAAFATPAGWLLVEL